VPWSDRAAQQAYEVFRELAGVLALRAVPLGIALFALGFWLIGRIPGGLRPLPYSLQVMLAAFVLAPLLLPYVALPFLRPRPGTRRQIRLRVRGLEIVRDSRVAKTYSWSEYDAFDFGTVQGVDLLKLRLRGTWLSRRLGSRAIVALAMNPSEVSRAVARDVLVSRGLHEEPLGEPT
jgi:hypothetical protein